MPWETSNCSPLLKRFSLVTRAPVKDGGSRSRLSLGARTCLRLAGGAGLLLFNVEVKRVGGGTPFEALSRVSAGDVRDASSTWRGSVLASYSARRFRRCSQVSYIPAILLARDFDPLPLDRLIGANAFDDLKQPVRDDTPLMVQRVTPR
jgi:hypothetical protein